MIDLEELERLEKAATPGPWEYLGSDSDEHLDCQECGEQYSWQGFLVESRDKYKTLSLHLYGMERFCKPDGELIAAARNALPALIAELRAAREVVEQAKKTLIAINRDYWEWTEPLYAALEAYDAALADSDKVGEGE